MSGDKKTHPDTAIPGWAKMGAETRRAATSTSNDTTSPQLEQVVQIVDFLGHSRESAVTLQHLTRLTGWGEREVRKQIESARRHGILILSDNRSGYWLSDDPAEAQRFARSMRHRAKQIRQTAAAVERAAGLD